MLLQSLNKYLLSTYYVLDKMLGAGVTMRDETSKLSITLEP